MPEENEVQKIDASIALAQVSPTPAPVEGPRSFNAANSPSHPDHRPAPKRPAAPARTYGRDAYKWKSRDPSEPFTPPEPPEGSLSDADLVRFSRKKLKEQQRAWRMALLAARWREYESGELKFLISIDGELKPQLVGGADANEACKKFLSMNGVVATSKKIVVAPYAGP